MYSDPALPTPALDFCQMVSAKQHDINGGSITTVPLNDDEQSLLDRLLQEYDEQGASTRLEARARSFLFTYREREQNALHVLTDEERAQLNQILASRSSDPLPTPIPAPPMRRMQTRFSWPKKVGWRQLVTVGSIVAALTGGVIIVSDFTDSAHQGRPPTGTAQQHPPAQQVAPGTTDLQNFKQDYGPFTQLTPSDQQPQTGSPALLLLESGGYFVSTEWTVTASAQGWQQDVADNVSNIDIKGDYADITDADANPYVVGVDQPFLVSGNPGTVLRIDSTGNVFSMSLAQATAMRQSLK